MGSPINIEELKNSQTEKDTHVDTIVDPNLGRNIDGKELRDFGNGMKEFDPAANGIMPEQVDVGKGDDVAALEKFDEQLDEKIREVQEFNDLIDASGGEVSEQEVREHFGQEYVTDVLDDGVGGKFEDDPGNKGELEDETPNVKTSELFEDKEEDEDSEIAELERELEDMDDSVDVIDSNESIEIEDNNTEDTTTTTASSETITVTGTGATRTVSIDPVVENISKPTVVPFVDRKVSETDENEISQEDKDLAALDGDTDDDDDDDFETKLKNELQKKLKPVSKKLDLSSATVIQKPVNVSQYAEKMKQAKRVFTWPLIRSGRPITIQSFNANELNILSNNARNTNMTLEVFRTIYKHIVSGKGESFETWAKSTSYFDVNHIWMAIYGCCFANANYLPFSCPKCNNVTVTTDTPIMDMVKFKNDEVKSKFNEIMNMNANDPAMGNIFAEYRVQISDTLVVGFVEPSIYTSIVENSLYDREFRNKYDDILSIINYISNIYVIDGDNLRPLNTKVYANNEAKTAKARVIQYAKIIRELPSDEYGVIMAHIIEMGSDVEAVSYQMPEITCDHCKEIIPAEDQDASSLVFTRHQLVMFGI